MHKHVYIDPRCLATSLVPSVLEEYHKEVSGYLFKGKGPKMRVISAYSLQTDIKMPTWVEHGNASAVKRVDRLMKTLKMNLIGGFHTHPLGPSKPSKSDIWFIQDKLAAYGLPHWLEIILSVKKKVYVHPHKIGWQLRKYEKKIGITIKTDPWTGYEITLSGFWVPPEGRFREATLWTSTRHNF